MPTKVFLDGEGLVQTVLAQSQSLAFSTPSPNEVSRILSEALAGAHEVVRRARRGELYFAQSLLDELRSNMARLDGWIQGLEPSAPHDLKLAARLRPALANAFTRSYVGLNAADLHDAVVALSNVLAQQIPELHRKFELNRPLTLDLSAVELVAERQVMELVRTSARALIQEGERMLVIRYVDNHGDWFALPGGGQRHGESLEEALRREVEEETGARIRVGALRFVRECRGTSTSRGLPPAFHQVELVFTCELLTPLSTGPVPDPSQAAAEWRSRRELRELCFFPQALLDALDRPGGPAYLGIV